MNESVAEDLVRDLSDPHSMERAVEAAREAREWEEERQEAMRSARKAVGIRSEAEARCVQAIRSVLPPSDDKRPAAVDDHDAAPPELETVPGQLAMDEVPGASKIERLLMG